MSRAKTERLLNLVICLLAARRYLSREEIRRAVPGYADSDEAFERSFERDKDELREMGIPVETGTNDPWFEDQVGYRIRRDAYALPEVAFAPDEMGVLALAARAWQQATLAGAASAALLKLRAYGVATDEVGIAGIEPRVDAYETAFRPLWEAVRDRRPVRFTYRRPGLEPEQRQVEPWGIVSWHGRWYLVGLDRDRDAPRVFRLGRILDEVVPQGPPGGVTVPDEVDLRAMVTVRGASAPQIRATVQVRAGTGGFLRRQAASTEQAGPGWDRLAIDTSDLDRLAEDVCALGPAAVALEPVELRTAVARRLSAVLAGSSR